MTLDVVGDETQMHTGNSALLLAVALSSALLGQYCFVGPPRHLLGGLLLYTVAVAAFWRLLMWDEGDNAADDSQAWRETRGGILLPLFLLSVACSAMALLLIQVKAQENGHYWAAFVLWVASMLLFLASLRGQAGYFLRWRWQGKWQEWLAVAALTALGFALRIVQLEAIPTLLAGDEAAMGLEALKVLDGSLGNMFATGWFAQPTMFFFVQALALRFLGATVLALRLSSALVGTLTIPILYAFVRRLWGSRVALCAASLLTAYHFHVHYSRLGLNNIEDALFAVLVFYFLCRALQDGQAMDFALCGLALGCSQYFYWGSRVLPLIVLLFMGWMIVRDRRFWPLNRRNLLYLMLAFALAVAPLASFFIQHPQEFWSRIKQTSIFQSGWLAQTAAMTGQSQWQLLWQQCTRAALAFNFFPDTSVFYGAPIPLLDYFAAVLFVLGLIYALYRWRYWPYTLLLLWLGLVVLFGGVLLVDPPASQRFLIISPLLCVLPAIGLDRLLTLAQNSLVWEQPFAKRLLAVILIFMVVGNARYYFLQYTPGNFFLEANSELADRAGRYIRNLGPDYHVYFAGAPRIYFDAPAIAFLALGVEGQDVLQPITESPELDAKQKVVFIFTPERRDELEVVRARYAGNVEEEFSAYAHELLFVAYKLS